MRILLICEILMWEWTAVMGEDKGPRNDVCFHGLTWEAERRTPDEIFLVLAHARQLIN